ncbi:hypothetical protein MC885_004492, partial [Smutsia gigantea]
GRPTGGPVQAGSICAEEALSCGQGGRPSRGGAGEDTSPRSAKLSSGSGVSPRPLGRRRAAVARRDAVPPTVLAPGQSPAPGRPAHWAPRACGSRRGPRSRARRRGRARADVQFFSTMNECHYDKQMDFFYNRSNTDTADEWTGVKLVIVFCVGTFFCLFIFFSNSLVIAAVIKNRKFHFPFYYLLANLAAADFFAGIAYVFLMFNTGPVSKTLTVNRWFLRQGLLDTSLTASLTNLLVIAMERHMSIMKMRVHSNLTKKRVTLLILLVWATAIFMGAVPTLGWNCLCDISACSSLAPIYSRSYLVFWTVSNLVAFLIMAVVYLRIYMYVKRKTNILSPHTSGLLSPNSRPELQVEFVVCGQTRTFVVLQTLCSTSEGPSLTMHSSYSSGDHY